jgi:copper(I)-binding protein
MLAGGLVAVAVRVGDAFLGLVAGMVVSVVFMTLPGQSDEPDCAVRVDAGKPPIPDIPDKQ